MQYIHTWFHHLLDVRDARGIVIGDSRTKVLNSRVAHSIFTQKFQRGGDPYPRIYEMPTFGHSENHAGVQIADLVCSAFLYPMAVDAYCRGTVRSKQVRKGYDQLAIRFGLRLRRLQHRGWDRAGVPARMRGGITTADGIGGRGGDRLFLPAGAVLRSEATAALPRLTPSVVAVPGPGPTAPMPTAQ